MMQRSTKTKAVDESKEFNIEKAAAIPMVYKGRTKPLDTVARNFLIFLSESPTFKVKRSGEPPKANSFMNLVYKVFNVDRSVETKSPTQFFFEVISQKPTAYEHRVFRITHPQLLEKLGLDQKRHRFRYALIEFADKIKDLQPDLEKVRNVKAGDRDSYQTALVDFDRRIQTYHLMANAFSTSFANNPQGIRQYHAMNENLLKFNPPLVVKNADTK